MQKNNNTRREFLKAASLGVTTLCLSSCTSWSGRRSKIQSFRFVQICDTQLGMGGYEHDVKAFETAVAQINALKPDFVVICGDLVNTANEASFSDFKKIKAELTVPCYCVPGNHDVGNEPSPESLQSYRRVMGEDYYSFEHKGYQFVFVNTQLWKTPTEGESKKHDTWVAERIEAAVSKKRPVFIVGHFPLFLEKPDETDQYFNLPLAKRKALLGLFEQGGVVAVLGGHTHKLLINEYKGIQLVHGETTSKNFDNRPFGFRLWHIGNQRPFLHEFVPLTGI